MEVFEIPSHKSELDVDDDSSKQNILANLQEARKNSRNGCAYIVEFCKAYFTAIYYCNKLTPDIIHLAYEDLHRGMKSLNESLNSILRNLNNEDEEEDESTRTLYLNILKMHIYCYTQLVIIFEAMEEEKNMKNLKLKRKKNESNFSLDKKQIIVHLNNLIQQDIKILWSPPIVEEAFINLISEVCYRFLQNAEIKNMKNVSTEIWCFLGTLIKNYNHGKTFVIRIVQLIKLHEHLIYCIPEGFKFLVDNYNCKSMIHDIVQELTEWQTDESYQDAQGARFCSSLLVEMAISMPTMMIPEVMYLNEYLCYESPTLRNCVLSVVTEVISKVLTKHEMNDEERESRDTLLDILKEHIDDNSPLVRSKVFQHWARLQKENAVPLRYQNEILEEAVVHLMDKGASVRKSASNMITTFLSYNLLDFDLQLHKRQKDLDEIENELKIIETKIAEEDAQKIKELEEIWSTMEEEIKLAIKEEFENESDMEMDEENKDEEDIMDLISKHLSSKNYKNAIKLCRTADEIVPDWKKMGESVGAEGKMEMILVLLRMVYIKPKSSEMGELYKNLEILGHKAEFLKHTVKFLTIIDSALEPMVELLETTTIGDMHEAIEFFIAAYQFNIDRGTTGIVEMLRIMQRNEQERKDAIVKAFKTIFLETNSQDISEHSGVISNRLIALLKNIPLNNLEDLQNVISEWTNKGLIDNAVIDMLWKYFTKKANVSNEDRIAALEILRMASMGRISIVKKNIKLISTIAFEKIGDKVQEDMLLVGTACKVLAVAGREKIDINSVNPPFKISPDDYIFQSLVEIFSINFFKNRDCYSNALPNAVSCIYQLCSKPEIVCEDIIKNIVKTLVDKKVNKLVDFQLVRFCQLISSIAINHLAYMDNTLYKELKRRQNIRQQRESQKKANKRRSVIKTHDSALNQSLTSEDSILEGVQAEDSDAEFILRVLENDTVSGSGLLGKLAFVIKLICQRPDVYDSSIIQGAAVIALIRYMLVSSRFCEDNMQLLFTIFEKTTFIDVKCTILYHCSDLLSRFPNIVEPWTPRIYQSLQNPVDTIRKATFFTLSNLILRDMIRIQGHISRMAKSIIDKDTELNTMSKTFFIQLSHKENNLYNMLPDIFSHLVEELESEDLRTIMKFLFGLMDKQKYMENLVERFCLKFQLTENNSHCRNIVYCLTLIHYNEKALRKLQENFPAFKHLVHDDEIYASFKQIFSNCRRQQIGKVDLKPIVAEIEQSVESVFEINKDKNGEMPPPRPVPPKSAKKVTRGKRARVAKKRRSSSSEDSD